MKPAGVFPSLAAGIGAFALAYFLLGLPAWIFLKSDDFGYIRTVLGSMARGGPYLYDWLAPYSAVMTAVVASGWALTGNLPLAALGFMAASSLAAFVLLFRLLSARLSPGWSSALALAFALTPTFFSKAGDIHGSIPTFALFLAALILHEERRPALFFIVAFLAFANRQSHLVLLALPMLRAAHVVALGRAFPAALGLGFALYAAGAAALRIGMNHTYAQVNAVFSSASLAGQIRASAVALAAGVFIAMGLIALFGAPWRSLRPVLAHNCRHPSLPGIASAMLVLLSFFWPADLIRPDFPLFGAVGIGSINGLLPWVILPALWILDYRLLRPSPYLALTAAFILVGSLRGVWVDYYFLEIAALCLLISVERIERPRPGLIAKAFLAALIAAGLGYAYLLKVNSDRNGLIVRVLESLERQGTVKVEEMSNAPFGYLGWKLFDYFLANDGRFYGNLEDFQGYVRHGRVVVETQVPWRRSYRSGLTPGAVVLDRGKARIGFAEVDYRVVDWHAADSASSLGGRPMNLERNRYIPQAFPLDRREWNVLRSGGTPPKLP